MKVMTKEERSKNIQRNARLLFNLDVNHLSIFIFFPIIINTIVQNIKEQKRYQK